jgi:hypothetical protein
LEIHRGEVAAMMRGWVLKKFEVEVDLREAEMERKARLYA